MTSSPSGAQSPPGIAGVFDRAADTYDAVGVPWFTPIATGLVEDPPAPTRELVLEIRHPLEVR